MGGLQTLCIVKIVKFTHSTDAIPCHLYRFQSVTLCSISDEGSDTIDSCSISGPL